MTSWRSNELRSRVEERIRHWRVVVEREVESGDYSANAGHAGLTPSFGGKKSVFMTAMVFGCGLARA